MLLRREGRRIHCDLLGERGRRFVCLVHALAADSGLWAEQVPPLLSAGFGVLRVDLRGHGGSYATPGPYAMEDLGADLAHVLRALDLGPVDYVGLSLGGMAGQALALDHPGLLRSVVICDALPERLPNADGVWGPRIRAVRDAGTCEVIADATMERWLTPAFKTAKPARWREIRDTVAATSAEGYAGCAEAISRFSFVARLPSLAMPALVLCGEHDEAVPPAEGRRIAALVPDGRFHAIPGARHLPNVERPDIFNDLLLGWLAHR
ncbi:alpha/beta fold hydrolase [Falsiroseomonas oryziterrae]|uniref:alpha/beta fold hydrolase n=1 Tax=Falsiroseomonas oryziterrae TaxID=2911368 RepID=UPI001F425573|nr:alpha/beta fold hydrolase [Roseomonas sp. NPKOSM-4]